jgi:hypothetical protein
MINLSDILTPDEAISEEGILLDHLIMITPDEVMLSIESEPDIRCPLRAERSPEHVANMVNSRPLRDDFVMSLDRFLNMFVYILEGSITETNDIFMSVVFVGRKIAITHLLFLSK